MTDLREELYQANLWSGLDDAFNRMEEGIEDAAIAASFAQTTANEAMGLKVRPGESVADAIAVAASNGGGVVRIGAGHHRIDSELFLSTGVSVVGEGSATVLEVPKGAALHSVFNTGSSAGASVRRLRMKIENNADFGLYSSPVAGTNYGDFAPDPCFRARGLFIDDARVAGVYLGSQARATHLRTIRVRRAGGWAYWLRNADSWIVDCEGTTTGAVTTPPDADQVKLGMTAGFYIGCVNTVIRGCKAWYCRGYGMHVRGSRNRISECESQDTKSHGWRVEYEGNIFTNCVADSASMWDVGGTVKGADGWYIDGVGTTGVDGSGANVFMGLQSFDRKPKRPEGQTAVSQQRYGFNVKKELLESGRFIGYSGFGNAVALVNARA